ncbi:MAG: hypothetical protein J5602_10375 [Clostridia bacterium]|nr:hypothetical protein [Clostridia bacterium]MBO4885705.1 hypothetical protein [Clostridia bacterium]
MRSCEKRSGFGCSVPCFLVKICGAALAVAGALLALIFIPIRMWLALLGVGLAAVGVFMYRMG